MNPDITDQVLDWIRNRHFGKYRGTVTNNSDDTRRGRIEVRVPAVWGNTPVWAMPCVPYAGEKVGFYSLPEPGTGVWVEFEGGDPSFPVWTGCFWADNELPDKSDAAIKIWKTKSLILRIDDNADEILVEASSGSKLRISKEIKSDSGGSTHTVGSGGVVSEAGKGKVAVTKVSVSINDGALEVT